MNGSFKSTDIDRVYYFVSISGMQDTPSNTH